MSIFYVNAPAFAVAVERQRDPSLERMPLAVASGDGAQAVLVCVSSEAHGLGIRRGQKVSEARRFDRRLRIVTADPVLYEKAQNRLLQVVRRYTPVYEAERPGSFYLDMSGTERLFGKAMNAAARVRADIARVLSLRATVGVAENKLVSRVAANVARPTGLCDVFAGGEAGFLAPLELDYLPAFADFTDRRTFQELALDRIGDVASVPLPVLVRIFGRKGQGLHAQAMGIDPGTVKTQEAEDTIAEDVPVAPETNDDRLLLFLVMGRRFESLGRRLRERNVVRTPRPV
jgi:DNA polymerase-4